MRQLDAVVVRVAPGTLAETQRKLLSRLGMAYVEVDHVARAYGSNNDLYASWRPNDTFLSQQWALDVMKTRRYAIWRYESR